jgi:multiple sugar transport system permease protein
MTNHEELPIDNPSKPLLKNFPFKRNPQKYQALPKKDRKLAFLYLSPSLLILGLIVVIPMGYAFYVSISKLEMVGGSFNYTLTGLANYRRLFTDPRFFPSLRLTAEFTFWRVIGAILLGLAVALVLNEASLAARILKKLFLIPWALSFVVNAIMWSWMYNASYGIINEILYKVGIISSYRSWLGDPNTALQALTVAEIWKAIPFVALVILAGIQSIPSELYEAAKVDGANVFNRFFHITLPGIRPVVLVSLVIQTMWSIMAFTTIWTLTQGGPVDSTMLLNILAYQQSFMFLRLDYGAALAFMMTLLILVLTVIYLTLIKIED